jgi:hypothetical protein
MLRSVFILMLAAALLVAPGLTFAFNVESFAQAKSCCDSMSGSCGDSLSPQSCCGSPVIRIEFGTAPDKSMVVHAVLADSLVIAPPSFEPAESWTNDVPFANTSPPARSSPPLVLRI